MFCIVSGLLVAVLFSFISGVCSQQQYFRVQPRDVKVHEGGEAMLECEVANLAGQVQWTKDGFALGEIFMCFSRRVEGEEEMKCFLKQQNHILESTEWKQKQNKKLYKTDNQQQYILGWNGFFNLYERTKNVNGFKIAGDKS